MFGQALCSGFGVSIGYFFQASRANLRYPILVLLKVSFYFVPFLRYFLDYFLFFLCFFLANSSNHYPIITMDTEVPPVAPRVRYCGTNLHFFALESSISPVALE